MNTKWMDPYERVALLEQELEDIEERETARIQEQSRQLSLEECVYWLVMADELGRHVLERIAQRDAREVRAVAYDRLRAAKVHKKNFEHAESVSMADFYSEIWRNRVTKARLLLEAAKRIREEKR